MDSGQDDVFGYLPSGDKVAAVTLTNGNGMAVTIIGYGAAIQSVTLPNGSRRIQTNAAVKSGTR